MRKFLLAAVCAVTAAGGVMIAPTPSEARDYPICSYGGSGGGRAGVGGIMRCEFQNFQQCKATTSGVGGYCMENPAFGANASWGGGWDEPRRPVRRQRWN